MVDNVVKTTYTAEIDQQSYNRVAKQLADNSRKQEQSAKQSLDSANKQSNALKQQSKVQRDLERQSKKSIQTEQKRLAELEKQNKVLRDQVASVGDVDSALSAIRGGIGGVTGVDVAGLEQAAGLFELTEAAVQLRGAAPAATESMLNLVGSLGATGIGLGAVAGVAVVGVVALADALSRNLIRSFQDTQRQLNARIDAEQQLADQLASGAGTDVIFNEFVAFSEQAEVEANKLAEINNRLIELDQSAPLDRIVAQVDGSKDTLIVAYNEQADVLAEATKNAEVYRDALNSQVLAENNRNQAIFDSVDSLREQFDLEQRVASFAQSATAETLDARLEYLDAEKQLIQTQLNELNKLVNDTSQAGQQAREQFEQLNNQLQQLENESSMLNGITGQQIRLRDEETKALDASAEAEKQANEESRARASTLSKLQGLESQATKALEDFARKQAEITQDRQLRDLRELEDYNAEIEQENAEHQRELAGIQRAGNQEVAELQNNIANNQRDYFADDIKLVETYQRDLRKLNAEYYREDKQALQDHLSELRDAEQNNDVLAFLQAQRSFKQEQNERKKSRNQEAKELADNLALERAERQRALQERQRDLNREIAESRRATQQRINDTKRAFEEERRIADQERQRNLQRQRQDDQLADQRRQQQLQRQLREIDVKAQAEIRAIRSVTSAIGELQNVANRISGSAARASGGSSSSGRYFGSTALGEKSYERNRNRVPVATSPYSLAVSKQPGRVRTAFATGGIVDRPTVALLGESLGNGEREAVIPFRASEGIASAVRRVGGGMASAPVINFSPNLTVGDIATGREVTSALQGVVNDLSSQILNAVSAAVNNTG